MPDAKLIFSIPSIMFVKAKSAGGRKNPTFGLRDPNNYVIMYFLLRMGSG